MASIPLQPENVINEGAKMSSAGSEHYDTIIVGAGFSGISALHRLRNDGMKAHIFEAASDFGGVWFWNRYPGARVDSETPFYQLSIPEVYNTFNFSQRFPDHREIRKYMSHVDNVLNLRKDVSFNSKVNSCTWNAGTAEWTVLTETGRTARARWLILATGLLHKAHFPEWSGRESYRGLIRHSADWPENMSVAGKRVAVIGAGATSVQIVQELAKEAAQLDLLLRRPSLCLPMGQREWTEKEHVGFRAYYPALFEAGRKSWVGFPSVKHDQKAQDVAAEEREKYFEEIWQAGGFQFALRNYTDILLDKDANKAVYDFWKKKVRERLTDEEKQKMMAPDEAPYFFGTKRSPLEHDYYDVLNQANVRIVNIKEHPIERFTEQGLLLQGEKQEREYDYIVCATGFDAFTGSLTQMGLKSKDGVDIKEVWAEGVRTYLGMMINGYPNAFMVYSPQAPTALSNGPTIIECQTDFICDTIQQLRDEGKTTIEPTREAEDQWKEAMNAVVAGTLYPYTNSWWNTSNVPGKPAENQSYILGIANYEAECRAKMMGWTGFAVGGAIA